LPSGQESNKYWCVESVTPMQHGQ